MSASISFQPDPSSPCLPGTSTQLPSQNTQFEDESNTFRNISVVKILNKAKFPVFLAHSKANKQNYAMKIFPYYANKPHPYFQNEARFKFLDHSNVIKTHHAELEREKITRGHSKKVSYTIMEYAPYGDFYDLIMNHGALIDDKLIRTYFRQLIEGLEYLHDNGVSHMDIKLENMLIGEDFNLKIADFDLSYMTGDHKIMSKGTKYYRAPEMIQERCLDTKATDIYSAGIVLFALKSRGILPHAEDSCVAEVDFAGLLYTQNEDFWKMHCHIQKRDASFFDEDFKELFHSMIALNPRSRATIEEIKKSKWYNGLYYSTEELKARIGSLFELHQ